MHTLPSLLALLWCTWVFGFTAAAAADPSTTNPIKIGAIYSLSSWAAIGGQPELDATLLAAEDINAQGGVQGRPLKIIYEDNRSDLATSVSAFNKLVNADGILALLGPNWAEFSEVIAPLAEKQKIPMLTASGYSWTLTKGRKFIFTTMPDFHDHVAPLADHIAAQNHARIAIIHSSSTYFDGIAEALRNLLSKRGKSVSHFITVNPQDADQRSIILKLQREKVDALVMFLQEGGSVPTLLKQTRALQYAPALYSYDLTYDEVLHKDFSLADGTIFFAYVGTFSPELKERYRSRFKMEPPWSVAQAYDNVFIMKHAIEKCGLEPQKIRDCIASADYTGAAGRTRFSESGTVQTTGPVSVLKIIRDGQILDLPGKASATP